MHKAQRPNRGVMIPGLRIEFLPCRSVDPVANAEFSDAIKVGIRTFIVVHHPLLDLVHLRPLGAPLQPAHADQIDDADPQPVVHTVLAHPAFAVPVAHLD